MKKSLFASLVLLACATLTETKVELGYQAAQKEAFVPYYMKNTDSSKIDAIKTDKACCDDCGDDSCGSATTEIFAKQKFVNLKNANTEKSAAGKLLITLVKQS